MLCIKKNLFRKVFQLYKVITGILSEDLNIHSFGHKTQSFRHNLNHAPNQKTSLTKVVQLYSVFKKRYQKTKLCIHLVTKHSHFVTIKTELVIKQIMLQKLFSYICDIGNVIRRLKYEYFCLHLHTFACIAYICMLCILLHTFAYFAYF